MNGIVESKIGHNIKVLREKANLTQDYVATQLQFEGCNITRSAFAKIEVGQRHLYPDELILIKQILNVSFDDILKI